MGIKFSEWQEQQLIKKGETQIQRLVQKRTGGKGLGAVDDKTRSEITAEMDDLTDSLLGWFYRGRRKVGDRDPRSGQFRKDNKPTAGELSRARELIQAVEHELRRGTRHLTLEGKQLMSTKQVLDYINETGGVILDIPAGSKSYLQKFGVEGTPRAAKTDNQRRTTG